MSKADPGLVAPPRHCNCGALSEVVQLEVFTVDSNSSNRKLRNFGCTGQTVAMPSTVGILHFSNPALRNGGRITEGVHDMNGDKIEQVPAPDFQPLPGQSQLRCPACGRTEITVKAISRIEPVKGEIVSARYCICNNRLCMKRWVHSG